MLKTLCKSWSRRFRGDLPPKSLLKIPRKTTGKVSFRGHDFNYLDPLSLYWSWHEIFGDEIYRFPHPTGSPTILDGGANLGLASLYFLNLFPNASITAIEPDPVCFNLLSKNLAWATTSSLILKNCALAGQRAWITGLRREQSNARAEVQAVQNDVQNGVALSKINPLVEWTWGDVWHYIATHGVDYNPLHDQFFPSIGCAPCTRAISLGEDFRAGRWWWENASAKECGLHTSTSSHIPTATESTIHTGAAA